MSVFRPIPVAEKPSAKLPLWFRLRRGLRRLLTRWWYRESLDKIEAVRIKNNAVLSDASVDDVVLRAAFVAAVTFTANRQMRSGPPTTTSSVINCPRCAALFLDAFSVNGGSTLQCRACGWSRLG